MGRLGPLLALAGLGGALLLLARQDLGQVAALLGAAGFGLVAAGLAHVLPMAVNARAWQVLLPGRARPSLATMTGIVWVRESVNGLLPVARVGGEVASFSLLRRAGVGTAPAVAGMLVDLALSMLSQGGFALLGLGLLAWLGGRVGWEAVAATLALALACGAGFMLAQRHGLAARAGAALNRVAAGRLAVVAAQSARVDRAARVMWRRRRVVLACLLWQSIAWVAGAVEVWLALHALGHPVGWAEAVAVEALVQALVSAGFVVPGGLGVQEGGFLGAGAALGWPPEVAAALAVARRVRDLVVFLPGLAAWAWTERRPPPQAAAGRPAATAATNASTAPATGG